MSWHLTWKNRSTCRKISPTWKTGSKTRGSLIRSPYDQPCEVRKNQYNSKQSYSTIQYLINTPISWITWTFSFWAIHINVDSSCNEPMTHRPLILTLLQFHFNYTPRKTSTITSVAQTKVFCLITCVGNKFVPEFWKTCCLHLL